MLVESDLMISIQLTFFLALSTSCMMLHIYHPLCLDDSYLTHFCHVLYLVQCSVVNCMKCILCFL